MSSTLEWVRRHSNVHISADSDTSPDIEFLLQNWRRLEGQYTHFWHIWQYHIFQLDWKNVTDQYLSCLRCPKSTITFTLSCINIDLSISFIMNIVIRPSPARMSAWSTVCGEVLSTRWPRKSTAALVYIQYIYSVIYDIWYYHMVIVKYFYCTWEMDR